MDISQFPERFRAKVLSSIVRNSRLGIAIRFGKLEGEVLPLSVQQEPTSPERMRLASWKRSHDWHLTAYLMICGFSWG